jgi:hypothetical protein
MTKKGFSYKVSEDDLRKWIKMSAEYKLEWLEEINRFLYYFASEKSRKIMTKFRRGEI